jgi:hypothetical protein
VTSENLLPHSVEQWHDQLQHLRPQHDRPLHQIYEHTEVLPGGPDPNPRENIYQPNPFMFYTIHLNYGYTLGPYEDDEFLDALLRLDKYPRLKIIAFMKIKPHENNPEHPIDPACCDRLPVVL